MSVEIPQKVRKIIDMLKRWGFESYAVGGCVRDSLLGIAPHDWDICTSATPEQMKRCFEGLRVIETGIQHGTLTVVVEDEQLEVTTYRLDGAYLDNRRPQEVVFVRNLIDDLSRRDFTVNSMAYNDETGLVDPFGGEADLASLLIRCVGDPDVRFREDALRIIRALRFAAVFQFEIEPSTAESIHKNKNLLNNIAVERVSAELGKLLCGQGVENVLRDYADVFAVFIPELVPMFGFEQDNPDHVYDVWEHTIKSIACGSNDLLVRLTMLLHDIAKPMCFSKDEEGTGHFYGHPAHSAEIAEALMKRLRFDNTTAETVKMLTLYHDVDIDHRAGYVKKLLNKLGVDNLKLLLLVKMADYNAQSPEGFSQKILKLDKFRTVLDMVLQEAQCFSLKDLAVSGKDLISMGVPPGPKIGEILKTLLDLVMDEALENKKEELLEAARKIS